MTREEILGLEINRDFDAIVATTIMGFINTYQDCGLMGVKPWTRQTDGKVFHRSHPVPHYSVDISAAWEIVEKMQNEHELVWNVWKMSVHDVEACFGRKPSAYGKTAPEAICKAALIAVMDT